MRFLVPVDGSPASLAALEHVAGRAASGLRAHVLLLHVQPRFHRHISDFTARAARDGFRAHLSRRALAPAIATLAQRRVPFEALTELGAPDERIAAVAERERVQEIVMSVGRHPAWLRWVNPSIAQCVVARTDIPVTVLARGHPGILERYAVPAGVAGFAALLWAVD